MNKRFLEAVATLTGTTIGAGVLAIPHVAAEAGLAVGLAYILVIGAAVIFLNILLAEVVLRTKGNHQLTGYVGRYLGHAGKRLMTAAMITGIYGAMLAYLIGAGSALNAIMPQLPAIAGSLMFFAFTTAIIYVGIKAVERSELVLALTSAIMLVTISAIALFSGKFSAANFPVSNFHNAALPYGVVLFSFLGAVAIPEMKEELGRNKALLRRAIIIGGLIPIAVYTLFAIAVVGISGAETGQIATIDLGLRLGQGMAIFANVFAVLAMSTACIALGLALKEMYQYDYQLGRNAAWLLTCAVPLAIFFSGVSNFIGVLGLAGAVAGGIEGILLVLMHRKAGTLKRGAWHKLVVAALIIMFAFGIAYALYNAF